ncbi:MAG: hypothetical protein ACKPKO_08605, partial [Candidatus Fonsibacter sp.]
MLRHAPDVLQGFLEGVQCDLRSYSFLLIEHLKCRSVVVVRRLQFEFCVGRAEVALEDTESYFLPPYAKFKLELAYDDDTPAFKVCDKKEGVRTDVALNSFKEALQHIRSMTKHCIVINFSKLYA